MLAQADYGTPPPANHQEIIKKEFEKQDWGRALDPYTSDKLWQWIEEKLGEVEEEVLGEVKVAYNEVFAGAGELFFPYVRIDDTYTREDELEMSNSYWEDVINYLKSKKLKK